MVNAQWLTTQLFLYKHDHYYDIIDDVNKCDFCSNTLTLACSLHTTVSFVQDFTCRYFANFFYFVCLLLHALHARSLFSTSNIWNHMQIMTKFYLNCLCTSYTWHCLWMRAFYSGMFKSNLVYYLDAYNIFEYVARNCKQVVW